MRNILLIVMLITVTSCDESLYCFDNTIYRNIGDMQNPVYVVSKYHKGLNCRTQTK